MKPHALLLLFSITTASSGALAGTFSDELILLPNDADATGATRVLGADFRFVDDATLVWKADKGDLTDGASIPRELQVLVGNPFDDDFIKAAVIHDHYCDKERKNRVRDWRDTHRVFYEMLRASGVPVVKSKIMYYAVYTFGPKWGFLDQGDICGVNCINNIQPRYFEKLEYSFDQGSEQEYMDVLSAIESEPDISLDALELLGQARHDDDRSFRFRPSPAAAE